MNTTEAPRRLREVVAAVECPDCPAEKTLWRDGRGLWHLTVHHEPTCPLWINLSGGLA